MRRLLFLGLTLALFMSLSGTVMGFTVTIYTDQTEWENALAGQVVTEDFNDQILNDGISLYTESGHINDYFGYYHDVLNSSSAKGPITIWDFTPQINAYGGTWTLGGPGGSGNYLLIYIDDIEDPVGIITNGYNGDFWGFISDTPFTSVTLIGGSANNQQNYQLDDMVYCPEE